MCFQNLSEVKWCKNMWSLGRNVVITIAAFQTISTTLLWGVGGLSADIIHKIRK